MSILTISSQQVLEDSVLSFNARTVLTLNGSTGYELILKQRGDTTTLELVPILICLSGRLIL